MLHRILHLIWLFAFLQPLGAADDAARFPWIDPDGIPGALLLCGNKQPSSSVVSKFGELARGSQSQIIVIEPTDNRSTELLDVIPGTIIDCGPFNDRRREQLIASITGSNKMRVRGSWYRANTSRDWAGAATSFGVGAKVCPLRTTIRFRLGTTRTT